MNMRRAVIGGLVCAMVIGCGKHEPAPPAAGSKPIQTATTGTDKGASPAADPAKAPANKEPAPVQNVLIWHAYRDAERAAFDKLIGAWNEKQPHIQVKALAVPFDALIDKMQVAIPRGNGPDLVVFAHDKIGTWARDKLIQPLAGWATGDRLGRFLPQTVKPLVFESAIYGLPLAFKSLVLFYNRAMIAKAPATLDELVTMAKAHTDDKDGRFGLAYDAADLYTHAAFLHAFGGSVYDDKAGKLTIDTPAAVQAVNAVRKLHATDKVLPKGMSAFVITAMFNDGKVPFVLNGPWFVAEIDKSVKWAIAPLPTVAEGKPLRPYLGSEAVMLSAKTKVKDAALTIMDYLTSDEAALLRLSEGKQMVANKKIYENAEWSKDPIIRVFRAQADVSVPMSNAVAAGLAWQPYSNALRKIIFGGEPAEPTLKAAQAQADAAFAKLQR